MSPAAVAELGMLTGAVVVGVWLGMNYLRRQRMRPGMIGAHFLLGAASLEVMVMTIHGGPALQKTAPGAIGLVALTATGLAMASGLIAGLIARRSRNTADVALATHAVLGAAGALLFLFWIFGTRGAAVSKTDGP